MPLAQLNETSDQTVAAQAATENGLSEEIVTVAENEPAPKKKKKKRFRFNKRKLKRGIFVFCMLAYPVFQFLVMWAFVNIDSILMTFQKYDPTNGWHYVGFKNYADLFRDISITPLFKTLIVNSVLHSLVGMFIIFPICLIISYFLCRKIPFSGFFRIIFYIPTIIPLVVLVLAFTNMINVDGLLGKLYEGFNMKAPELLAPGRVRWTVYGFTVWAGIGGNLLLLSGTIKRVPEEVLESARLDGIGILGELFRVVVPMIWPTLVTLFIMSMMGIFSVVFQPLFINAMVSETMTIGLWIFNKAADEELMAQAATFGIMCTIIVAPIILLTRWGLDKFFSNVNY